LFERLQSPSRKPNDALKTKDELSSGDQKPSLHTAAGLIAFEVDGGFPAQGCLSHDEAD